MILGIGTDIIEIKRVEQLLTRFGNRFWKRILTASEQAVFHQKNDFAKSNFLAKRFAAKEAVSKALGTGIAQGITFHDIEIKRNQFGKPLVMLHNIALHIAQKHNATNIHLSLSDEHTMIVAFAVIEAMSL